MNDHDLHSLRAVAEALGVPPRRVRSWADAGSIDTLQPGRGAERLVPTSEVRRLERAGYRVSWDTLRAHPADAADPSHAVLDTETAIP